MIRADVSCADTTPEQVVSSRHYRIWLWPNLLSLDAPAVAIAWQLLFARCLGVWLPPSVSLTLGLCVWMIYAADRVLDGLRPNQILTARHRFYREHCRFFTVLILALLPVIGGLAIFVLPPRVFQAGLALTLAVCVYLACVHLGPKWRCKELAVGVVFALGTCIPVWAEAGEFRFPMLLRCALFAGLCWMNCLAIDHWESQFRSGSPALRLCLVGIGITAALLAISAEWRYEPIYVSVFLSAAALGVLERLSRSFSRDVLRVTADLALLTPLLFLVR